MSQDKGIHLIVGLGNPGSDYERTRHNAGFWFLDALAHHFEARFRHEPKFNAELARIHVDDADIWLLKPMSFMNLSGHPTAAAARYYKIEPDHILVVHDELDLPPGTMKYKLGGGHAGHNGIKDITAQLGTSAFHRLRLGIGHPRTFGWSQAVADFVLSAPSPEHREGIDSMIAAAVKALPRFASGDFVGVTRLLAKYGQLPKPKADKKEPQSGCAA